MMKFSRIFTSKEEVARAREIKDELYREQLKGPLLTRRQIELEKACRVTRRAFFEKLACAAVGVVVPVISYVVYKEKSEHASVQGESEGFWNSMMRLFSKDDASH